MRTPLVLLGLATAAFAGALTLTLVAVASEGAIERRSRPVAATVLDYSDRSDRLDLRVDSILGPDRYRSIQVGPMYDDFDPGEQVELLVDRTNPDRVHLRGNERAVIGSAWQALLPWIWVVGGALLLSALLAWWSWFRLRAPLVEHGWHVLTLRRGAKKVSYVADAIPAAFTSWTVLPRYFEAEVAGPLDRVALATAHCVVRVRGRDELVLVGGPLFAPDDSEVEAGDGARPDLVPPDPDAVSRFLALAVAGDGEPTTNPAAAVIAHHAPSDGPRCGLWSPRGLLLGLVDHGEKRLLDAEEQTVMEWEQRPGETAYIVEDVDVAVHSRSGLTLTGLPGSLGIRRRRGEYVVSGVAGRAAHGLLHTGRASGRAQWRCAIVRLDEQLEGWERSVVLLDTVLGLAVVPPLPASD